MTTHRCKQFTQTEKKVFELGWYEGKGCRDPDDLETRAAYQARLELIFRHSGEYHELVNQYRIELIRSQEYDERHHRT